MKKAFTLIEVLVAIVLLSLLIAAAVFAFRLELLTIKKIRQNGLQETLTYHQLHTAIESMKYYVVQDYDAVGRPMKSLHYYFHGLPQSVQFITTSPIMGSQDTLIRLKCEGDKLLYLQEPLFGRIDYLRPRLQSDSRKKILMKNLKKCGFSYVDENGRVTTTLKRVMPRKVMLFFKYKGEDRKYQFYVKSDDNYTISRVMNVMFSPE